MTLRILIVDDREDVRETLREIIELNISGGDISVEDMFPLPSVADYPSYVRENDVAAIVLDERLNESRDPATGIHIDYFGHDVVDLLRRALPDFPIYVVTTFGKSVDLLAKEEKFEDVVERDEFMRKAELYSHRIQRAASRFRSSMQQSLVELNDLTLKAAEGKISPEEMERLTAVRQVLGLPFSGSADLLISDLVFEARSLAQESEDLLRLLQTEERK
ncbi:hypothetical protein ACIPLR_11280 [Herbaspirillum huttiense]|uniref:hypothetical protein n=1 Tax=Herbaspirillum huttiense TaxID=863372 RepID=UPI0038117923